MGLIRFSSIVNTSVSYLTFLKKKKKSKKRKNSSSSLKYIPQPNPNPNPNPINKLPDSSPHKENKEITQIIPKKLDIIDIEKQFTPEKLCVDEKECAWLSTDRPSTNAYFDQCRSSLSHFLLDERLNVWLSRSSISKVTEWLSRPSAIKAADWLTRASLSKDEESFILGRDLPSEEAEIFMLTSSARKSTHAEDVDHNALNMMISSVNLDDSYRSSISGTALLEGSDGEPLFWPFELKFEMDGDEKVGYFSMSPRKLEFSKSVISRVSTSSNSSCAKLVALSLEGGSVPMEKILSFKRDWLGSEDISFSDQVPVENLLGLGEFDGHEGLGDEDTLSLDGWNLKN